MTLAEHIVDMLLDNEGPYEVDPVAFPHLYPAKGEKSPEGLEVYGGCPACEQEHYGGRSNYRHNCGKYSISHGTCKRHGLKQWMQIPGMTQDRAEQRLAGKPLAPDWQEVARSGAAMPPSRRVA